MTGFSVFEEYVSDVSQTLLRLNLSDKAADNITYAIERAELRIRGPQTEKTTKVYAWASAKQGLDATSLSTLKDSISTSGRTVEVISGTPTRWIDLIDSDLDNVCPDASCHLLFVDYESERNHAFLDKFIAQVGIGKTIGIILQSNERLSPDRMKNIRERLMDRMSGSWRLVSALEIGFVHNLETAELHAQINKIGTDICSSVGSAKSERQIVDRLREDVAACVRTELNLDAAKHFSDNVDLMVQSTATSFPVSFMREFERSGYDRVAKIGVVKFLIQKYLERIPSWCAPWKSYFRFAAATIGALEKIPTAFFGSLFSILGLAQQASHNNSKASEFQVLSGEHFYDALKQSVLSAWLNDPVNKSIRNIVSDRFEDIEGFAEDDISLLGVDEFARALPKAVESEAEQEIKRNRSVLIYGVAGTVLFWVFAIWPIVIAYGEYIDAISALRNGIDDVELPLLNLPALASAAFLGFLPMFALQSIVMSRLLAQNRVDEVWNVARAQIVEDLRMSRRFGVRTFNTTLDDIRFLLNLGPSRS